jgi:hypothetical protein
VQKDDYTILNDVTELANGDIVACGQSYNRYQDSLGNPKENNDFYLVVLDKNGNIKAEHRWGSDFKDVLTRIIRLRDGNIVVGGSIGMITTPDNTYVSGGDLYLAKISSASLGVVKNVLIESQTIEIYPNPANSTINIKSDFDDVKEYRIYDVLGRVVKRIEPQGNMEISFGCEELPAGVYQVSMSRRDKNISVGQVVIVH